MVIIMKSKKNLTISLFLIFFLFSFTKLPIQAEELDLVNRLYINNVQANDSLPTEKKLEWINLKRSISNDVKNSSEFVYILKEVNLESGYIVLEDESIWQIGWFYRNNIKYWKPGNRVKIFYKANGIYSNNMQIQNIDIPSCAWGVMKYLPAAEKGNIIARIPNSSVDPEKWRKIVLKSGWVFLYDYEIYEWKVYDRVFIFHRNDGKFDVWNIDQNQIAYKWQLIGNEKPNNKGNINLADVLNLESKLNERVLSQKNATKAIAASILNYVAGLKKQNTPISVFLFLGPTGVGKTELAKVLTDELFKSQEYLVRFDMSHFNEPYSITRLIGSPPGYVNHEEGGQLTEALKARPQSVVLLDEIEKAHPQVRKLFLPVFDDGYITDAKNCKVSCEEAVFISTSNICGPEIAELANQGFSPAEILEIIEPVIIDILSPELYNRVEPIIFHPLDASTMKNIVDLMLKETVDRLKMTKDLHLIIDESVKEYLIIHGYHPTLGARPLKKLIDKVVLANLSFAIINESIPEGSQMTISYTEEDDSWHVSWQPPQEA